ncbi:MAG: T9SS type A sorting domain-containing protein [bacterium]|nr:T9SS type A sorting domain-containing protein [bacterium]
MKFRTLLTITSLLAISFSNAQAPPNYVPIGGIQGWWPLDGNANETANNTWNGTLMASPVATFGHQGVAGTAYLFNGINQYITTLYPGIGGSAARAVSFWAKTSLPSPHMTLVGWGGNNQGERFACTFNALTTGVSTDLGNTAMTYSTNPGSPVNDNLWHHYVWQCNGPSQANIEIYQDAVLLTQLASNGSNPYNASTAINTITNNIPNASYFVDIARLNFTTTAVPGGFAPSPAYFNGSIDDVGIWNRMLSTCEIMQLYTCSLSNSVITVTGTNSICAGQTAVLTANGATNYSWSNATNGAILTVSPAITTTYMVTGTTVCSGVISNTVTVSVKPNPTITALADPTLICTGHAATITASGASSYLWNTSSISSSIVVSPTATVIYTVTGTGANGCSQKVSVQQSVSKCLGIEKAALAEPAIFYPNPSDGLIHFMNMQADMILEVYDVLGSCIYKSEVQGNSAEIDLRGQNYGIYFVKINSPSVSLLKKIIMKQ